MNNNTLKQAGIVTLMLTALLFVISWGSNAFADNSISTQTDSAIVEAGLRDTIQAKGSATYLVILKEQADLSAAYEIDDWETRGWYVYDTLRDVANRSQADLLAVLRNNADVIDYQPYFIVNAIHVTSGISTFDAVAAHPSVDFIEAEKEFTIPEPEIVNSVLAPEWGVEIIRATEVWSDFGIFGAGVVLATIDTGVQYNHPALEDKYRGTATGSHDFNFFDPANICAGGVCDNNGHGTHVTGSMLGDDGGANQIGVAPEAQWIAAKGCESNFCSDASLLASAEWLLAPCEFGDAPGSPSCDPSMRPHVINNSWGGGQADPWYQPSVDAWRAAGILPVFSAGNSGPGAGTINSPSDYCNVMSIGGTNSGDGMYNLSSRGPGSFPDCTDKPDMSAPGQGVRSSVPTNAYAVFSGTSMASPHVSGCIALMLSVAPMLDYDQVYDILTTTAADLGTPGFNYDYGHGRIDCYEAVLEAQVLAGPTGTLEGEVTADGSGDPLAGALIEATLNVTTTRTALTDAAGEYIMTFVPEGTYDVTASLFGYLPQTVSGVEVISGTVTTQDFALELAPSHTVSGVVTDGTTGWPLYASIEIMGADIPPVWTDPADGSYSIILPEGITYTFMVEAWVGGYEVYSREVGPLTGDLTEDFGLQADLASCSAPGYSLNFLYFEDFQADDGGFTTEQTGTNPAPWEWGEPVTWPGECPAGTNCWGTNLDGNYNNSAGESLTSPVIDLSAIAPGEDLTARWYQANHVEHHQWDQAFAEVSIDGGAWQVMWQNPPSPTVQEPWRELTYDISAAAGTNVQFRFRLLSDSIINFAGYYVDAIGIAAGEDCMPEPGGLVVGNVYDDNTMEPLVGSAIAGDSGQITTAVATPDDPDVDDAFYTIFAPAGSNVLTATIGGGYGPDTATVTVNDGETVHQNFWLPAGWIDVDPESLDVTVEFGSMATFPLTLTNLGGLPADYALSTLLVEEHFEGDFPPNGWEVVDNGGDCVWQRNDEWPRPNYAGGDGFSAAADSDACGIGTTMNTELRTPVMDLSGATVAGLDFIASYQHLGASSFSVRVSDDGGSSWDTLLSWSASVDPTGPGAPVSLDLTPYVGSNQVIVSFHYIATGWHWWAQVDQIQILADTGAWLSLDPAAGTLAASGGQAVIDATFDGTNVPEPGQYTTAINVAQDTPYDVDPIDVTMNVIPSPDMGMLQGTVNSQGYCDSDPFPAAGANVLIESATNTWTRTADENGYYSFFVNAGQSPLTVTVSAPVHEVGVETDVIITAQMTTTVDFDLRWLVPCIDVDPDEFSQTLPFGQTAVQTLTLSNNGGYTLTFELREQDGGFTPAINVRSATRDIGDSWETMAPLPAGRVFNAVVADENGYIYVIGGTSNAGGTTPTNTNYRYDTSTNTWSTMAAMPASLMSLNGVEVNNKIYVPGDATTATTYVYDIATDSWSSIPANGGYTARSQYQIVAIGTDVYVLGGIVAAASASTTQVWKLDTTTDTWSAGTPMQRSRTSFSAAAIDGQIYAAGGVAFPGFAPDMTAEKFDGAAWSFIAPVPGGGTLTRWSYNAAAHGEDGLWLAAGRRDTDWNVLNHAGYYDPSADAWTTSPDIPTLAQGRVYMEGAVATDGYFYVIGGRDSAGSVIYANNERLYVGYPGSGDVEWLDQDPQSGEVAPDGGEMEITITFDAGAVTQAGDYFATLRVVSNDPMMGAYNIPVTMTVEPSDTAGRIEGVVQSLGYCDDNPFPAEGAEVVITSGTNSWTVYTDANGEYGIWLDESFSPVDISVTAPDHTSGSASGVVIVPQEITTVNFDLRWLQPCVSVDPESFDVEMSLGSVATYTLQIHNSGAGATDYAFENIPAAVVVNLPASSVEATSGDVRQPILGDAPARSFATPLGLPYTGGSYAVLLLTPDANISDLQAALAAFSDLNVTTYAGNLATLTAAELEPYDVVMTTNNTQWAANAVQVGNALADYVDLGGRVILNNFAYDWFGWELDGRFITEGYGPFTGTSADFTGTSTLGTIHEPDHPIMAGVTAISNIYLWQNPTLAVDAVRIADWHDGNVFVAANDVSVALNILPSDGSGGAGWTGDLATLYRNAIIWLAEGDEPPGTVDWLSQQPMTGMVDADSSAAVSVIVDTRVLTETGVYNAVMRLLTDDPMYPVTDVPVTLTVTDPAPAIALSVTLSLENECGTENTLNVAPGTEVYYCYTVTNTGNVMLPNHTITDTVYGHIATFVYDLMPGETESVIFPQTVDANVTSTARWTASHAGIGVSAMAEDTATVTVGYTLHLPIIMRP